MADEVRSITVPPAFPGQANNVGVAIPSLPGRLLGGTAVRVATSGVNFTVNLDLSKLGLDPGSDPATPYVAIWREGAPVGDIFRIPASAVPVDWASILNKPATFPPTLPIAQSGVTGLVADLAAIDGRLDGLDGEVAVHETRLDGLDTLVATKLGDAPSNANTYGRQGGAWVIVPGLSDGNKGDITVTATGATWTINTNAVTFAKLQQLAALSVPGNGTNATANMAALTAGTDGHVLRRSGTTLGFGTIATAGVADDAITNAKLANMAAATVKGSIAGGDPADLTGADVRVISAQSWVELDKQTLGAAAAALIVPLTGTYKFYRLRFFFRPNGAIADFFTFTRFSSDGGATYKAGAGDYVQGGDFTGGGGVSGGATAIGSFASITGTTDTAFPEIGIEGELMLVQGAATRRPRGRCMSTLYNGTDYYFMRYMFGATGTYAVTHLQVAANIAGNAFDAGTFYTLEGSHG